MQKWYWIPCNHIWHLGQQTTILISLLQTQIWFQGEHTCTNDIEILGITYHIYANMHQSWFPYYRLKFDFKDNTCTNEIGILGITYDIYYNMHQSWFLYYRLKFDFKDNTHAKMILNSLQSHMTSRPTCNNLDFLIIDSNLIWRINMHKWYWKILENQQS